MMPVQYEKCPFQDIGFTTEYCIATVVALNASGEVSGTPARNRPGSARIARLTRAELPRAPGSEAFNHVGSYFVFGRNGAYNLDSIPGIKGLQVFTQVDNMLNRNPPFAATPAASNSKAAPTRSSSTLSGCAIASACAGPSDRTASRRPPPTTTLQICRPQTTSAATPLENRRPIEAGTCSTSVGVDSSTAGLAIQILLICCENPLRRQNLTITLLRIIIS